MDARFSNNELVQIRRLMAACLRDGTVLFNQREFANAILQYQTGVALFERLNVTGPEAEDWRELIGLYINISDAHFELGNLGEANVYLQNALNIFNCIKNEDMTAKERALPRNDARAIHTHYQQFLATSSYTSRLHYQQGFSPLLAEQTSLLQLNSLFGGVQIAQSHARGQTPAQLPNGSADIDIMMNTPKY